jgi:hypothetical protein
VRKEAGTNPGGARATSQWARLAFPVTRRASRAARGRDLPAALLSVSGERPPPADDRSCDPRRLQAFGRAALRTLTALDNAPDADGAGSSHALVTVRKVLPLWAVRLLVAALLLAPVLVAVDGFARVRRRHEPVGAVGVVARGRRRRSRRAGLRWFLGRTGLLPATPPEPVAAGAIPVGTVRDGGAGGHRDRRAAGLDRAAPGAHAQGGARSGPFAAEGAGPRLLVTWCAVAGRAVAAQSPMRPALLVPGAHALLAVVAPECACGAAWPSGLVLIAAAPFLLVDLSIAGQLGLSPAGLRVVLRPARRRRHRRAAGLGHLEPRAHVPGRRRCSWRLRSRASVTPPRHAAVTVRGPVSYAGPGSLGATESALRR